MPRPRPALKLVLLLVGGLLPGACASLASTEPPVCDGRSRRPANPWGSILTPPLEPDRNAASVPVLPAEPATYPSNPGGEGGCA